MLTLNIIKCVKTELSYWQLKTQSNWTKYLLNELAKGVEYVKLSGDVQLNL